MVAGFVTTAMIWFSANSSWHAVGLRAAAASRADVMTSGSVSTDPSLLGAYAKREYQWLYF